MPATANMTGHTETYHKQITGFTLLELIVTVAISVLLMTVAVPSFRSLIANSRITTQANQLVTSLNLARSEAVKRNIRVRVCKSSDGTSCTTSGEWQQGWIVFSDLDKDGTVDTDGDSTSCESGEDCILNAVSGPLAGGATLTSTVNFVEYLPGGTANATATFTHTIPHCTGKQGRSIGVGSTGRVTVSKTTCS